MSFNFNANNYNNSYNDTNNDTESYPDRQYIPPPIPDKEISAKIMSGQKVLSADRDEINDKMSNLRLQSYNNQVNRYYQPFRPDLINVESTLNRNHFGKKTEFKDTINNRLSNCHNSQLVQSQPSHLFDNKTINQNTYNSNQSHNPSQQQHPNQQYINQYQNDRFFNNNNHQTNKFTHKDKNNDRLANLMPLSNNTRVDLSGNQQNTNQHINQHMNQNINYQGNQWSGQNIGDPRIGYSSNAFLDDTGKLVQNLPQQNNQTQNHHQNDPHFIHNCNQKPNYMSEEQYQFITQNVMTVGRLPESNQSSRVNFKDKANQRLQNLVSLPRTSSLPVVPVHQPKHKDLWKKDQQNSQNMKKRINELNPNCQVVVNEMMPVNTQLLDDN